MDYDSFLLRFCSFFRIIRYKRQPINVIIAVTLIITANCYDTATNISSTPSWSCLLRFFNRGFSSKVWLICIEMKLLCCSVHLADWRGSTSSCLYFLFINQIKVLFKEGFVLDPRFIYFACCRKWEELKGEREFWYICGDDVWSQSDCTFLLIFVIIDHIIQCQHMKRVFFFPSRI